MLLIFLHSCAGIASNGVLGLWACREHPNSAEEEDDATDDEAAERAGADGGDADDDGSSEEGGSDGKEPRGAKQIVMRSAGLLLAGTAVCAVFSDPMVEAVSAFSKVGNPLLELYYCVWCWIAWLSEGTVSSAQAIPCQCGSGMSGPFAIFPGRPPQLAGR